QFERGDLDLRARRHPRTPTSAGSHRIPPLFSTRDLILGTRYRKYRRRAMRPIKTILQHHHDPSPPVGGPWFPVGEPTPPRMPCLPPPTGRASGNFHADPCRAGCVLSVRLRGPP